MSKNVVENESFRPPTTPKKMPKIWPLGVGPSKPSRFPPPLFGFFPWNQLTAETPEKCHKKIRPTSNRDPGRSSKRMFENPGGDEKSCWKAPGWQLGVAERLVTFGHSTVNFRFGSTHKKMAETDLSKTEVGTRICCGGKAGHSIFCGFSPWETPLLVAEKKTQQETNLADWGSVVQKIGGGFIWGDLEVCVQRWSLVWRQELAVCVRALGNMKAARCMPAPSWRIMGLWILRSQGDRRFYTEVKEGADIHLLLCVGERGRGMVVSKNSLWFDLEHFFRIFKIQF